MGVDAKRVLKVYDDPRPRVVVVGSEDEGGFRRPVWAAAKWYVKARRTLTARELQALDALEHLRDYGARDRRFLQQLAELFRSRRCRRWLQRAGGNARAKRNVKAASTDLEEYLGGAAGRPRSEQLLRRMFLAEQGFGADEIADLLQEPSEVAVRMSLWRAGERKPIRRRRRPRSR